MGQLVRRSIAAVVVVASVASLGACGTDVPTRDEFIEYMKGRVEDRTLPAAVYGCTYDSIHKDRPLLDAAMSDKQSDKVTAELRTVFSRCILKQTATTTTRPASNR